MAERYKAPDLSSGSRRRAWVRNSTPDNCSHV
ncbi:hypothetical protein TNCV_2632501, partial [Trichonephila clavipes]